MVPPGEVGSPEDRNEFEDTTPFERMSPAERANWPTRGGTPKRTRFKKGAKQMRQNGKHRRRHRKIDW